MECRPRIYYRESQKALMWERWRKGESLQQIAQLFDRNHTSIQGILARTGGVQPLPRCRSQRALSLAEAFTFGKFSLLAFAVGLPIKLLGVFIPVLAFTKSSITTGVLLGLLSLGCLRFKPLESK